MRFRMKTAVLVIGLFALSACDRSHDEAHEHPPAGAPTAPHDDGHGHDHPHGSDHSHDDPHTETFFGPDATDPHRDHDHHDHGHDDGHGHEHDDDDEHTHDDEEPHEH